MFRRGHMANITLDIVSYNFGIQEYTPFNAETQEIFKGCPEMKDGYFWVNAAGLGNRGRREAGGEVSIY